MIRLVLLALGVTIALYAVVLLLLWRFQERVVFQPPGGTASSQLDARRVRYRSSDGIDLFAFLVGECTADSTLLVAFHGNADLSQWLIPWAATAARETGACVMIPEYRGYDGVAGTPTYAGSALDARAAVAFVRDSLGVPREQTVYFGHSLGTAIAAELAAIDPPRSLVLESPFSSAREMGRRMFLPGLALFWPLVSRVHFDTIDRVRGLETPVWVSHGDDDFIIPVHMGREVFAAAKRQGELLIVHGAGHNDVAEKGGAAYWTWLRNAVAARSSVTRGAPAETRSGL